MSFYTAYLEEIEKRKDEGLNPKPIEDGMLLAEIIEQIRDRRYYKKPSDVRRHKKQAAIRRHRRDLEKQKTLQSKRERSS